MTYPLFAPDNSRSYQNQSAKMPLDTSTTYPLTRLRLDGRRWNELRLLQAQISTNPASSGSSYLSMGNTSIMCSVHGPAEGRRGDGGGGAAGSGHAVVEVDVNVAGFAGVDRKRRAGGSDRYAPSYAFPLSPPPPPTIWRELQGQQTRSKYSQC